MNPPNNPYTPPAVINLHKGSPDRPTHPQLVEGLCKKPEALLGEWQQDPRKVHLLHMASKLVSEAGEIAECVYAHVYYDKPLDIEGKDGIIKEMGDLEFYLEGIRAPLEISRDEVLRRNIDKLLVRYGGLNYSNAAAIARVDKNSGTPELPKA